MVLCSVSLENTGEGLRKGWERKGRESQGLVVCAKMISGSFGNLRPRNVLGNGNGEHRMGLCPLTALPAVSWEFRNSNFSKEGGTRGFRGLYWEQNKL